MTDDAVPPGGAPTGVVQEVPGRPPAGPPTGPGRRGGFLGTRRGRRLKERAIEAVLLACGVVSVLTTLGIVAVLVTESAGFFRDIPILEFLTGTRWAPLYAEPHFGILPLVNGTVLIAIGSSIVALPTGLAIAIYLSEYAAEGLRRVLKPTLEVLAGIPTVVYGYFALTFVTPLLRVFFPGTGIFNAASAAIVVGIMILPMVSSLAEDALRAVPRSLREAGFAVGATRFEVSLRVVVPGALSGIVAAFILAVSRAVGETMIVVLAAGATPRITFNFLDSVQTMTAYIVQVSLGETPHGTLEYRTIFAVGLLLFLMTLAMNILSQRVTRRFREVYE